MRQLHGPVLRCRDEPPSGVKIKIARFVGMLHVLTLCATPPSAQCSRWQDSPTDFGAHFHSSGGLASFGTSLCSSTCRKRLDSGASPFCKRTSGVNCGRQGSKLVFDFRRGLRRSTTSRDAFLRRETQRLEAAKVMYITSLFSPLSHGIHLITETSIPSRVSLQSADPSAIPSGTSV